MMATTDIEMGITDGVKRRADNGLPLTQEWLNSMMREPGEAKRPAALPLPECPQCGERYCGDGVALCTECANTVTPNPGIMRNLEDSTMNMIERLKQATETCEEADSFALLNHNPRRFGELDQLVVDADNRCRDFIRRHGREVIAEIEGLQAEIVRLLESRERESARLDWLLGRIKGDELRRLVGEMSCTSDAAEWRDKIDSATYSSAPYDLQS